MKAYQPIVSIKCWAEDDRPRDKLLLKGRQAISDAELLAILLGSGTKGATALDLGKEIMSMADNNLLELSRFSVGELTSKFKGIGKAKAINIIAALELGNRRNVSEVRDKKKITSSQDAYDYLKNCIGNQAYEEFWVLLLSQRNRVIKAVNISVGGVTGTVADPKKIFRIALENNACSIILSHNHPSGQTSPSEADIQLSRQMKQLGILMELAVVDHIIIGDQCYYSMADEGIL